MTDKEQPGDKPEREFPLFIVTGLSGAGKSTALKVFEDLKFFSVDGLPVGFLPKLADLFISMSQSRYRGLAIGIDSRQHDFLLDWNAAVTQMREAGVNLKVVFIEADNDILVRRYAETRRPHPLEDEDTGLGEAIEKEEQLLTPIRHEANLTIDTTQYSIHDLRRDILERLLDFEATIRSLKVHIITFGFKYGVPSEADLVFDLRFLPNPYFVPELKPLNGKDEGVAAFVLKGDPGKSFVVKLLDFLEYLLPLYEAEGRYRVSVAIGCTGGRHRSVAAAEAVFQALKKSRSAVSLEHRHLELG